MGALDLLVEVEEKKEVDHQDTKLLLSQDAPVYNVDVCSSFRSSSANTKRTKWELLEPSASNEGLKSY